MTVRVDMGVDGKGDAISIDLEELLATRLLVQGNSGSGKSHLLRRLLEKCAGQVQQVVIDPEGDFVTLADRYGHVPVEAADHSERDIARLAARIREHGRGRAAFRRRFEQHVPQRGEKPIGRTGRTSIVGVAGHEILQFQRRNSVSAPDRAQCALRSSRGRSASSRRDRE